MADITIKGWKCDICEKGYFPGDAGYDCDYKVETSCNTGSNGEFREECHKQVCCDCVESISAFMEELKRKNETKTQYEDPQWEIICGRGI